MSEKRGALLARPRNEWSWLTREHWEGAAASPMLAEINALPQLLRPLTAGDVIIRGMYLMNDQPMHENTYWVRKFDANAIAQTVPMVPGKPVLVNHTTEGMDGLPVGRFFHAAMETRPTDGSTWMTALFFMMNDQQGQRLANAIDGGIIAENSPTLEYGRVYCSICGANDLNCDHVPGELYNGLKCYAVMTDIVDFWEGSLAWAGMQKNTGFYIAAGRDPASCVELDDHLAALAKQREEAKAVTDPWGEYMKAGQGAGLQDGSPGT